MAPAGAESPYDAVPYPGHAFPQTHPDRLATVATLLGLGPAPPATCRVLELGCGDGGNLVPMGLGLPEASFLGVDAAPGAVARARATAKALGLANVRFEVARIEHLAPDRGGFDYVVAHGVYSWVPAPVRDALLAACRAALAPHGVAFVSYNALPGARLRQALWDMLRAHTGGLDAPADRLAAARALLRSLVAGWADEPPFAAALRAEAERLVEGPDATLFHDDLAAVNEPVLFGAFAAHAARHGLTWLGEADFTELPAAGTPREAAVGGIEDPVAREQHLDFVTLRAFRQTLLCRGEGQVARTPRAEAVAGMAVTSALERAGAPAVDGAITYAAPAGATLTTDHPAVAAALDAARAAWPGAAPVEALLGAGADPQTRTAVCEVLLRCCAVGLVQLHVAPPRLAGRPGPRPQASPLARLQAAAGDEVTTLRHTTVRLDDEAGRRLVTLLDGSRDAAALAAAMRTHLAPAGGEARGDVEAGLERGLARLAELGLLTA